MARQTITSNSAKPSKASILPNFNAPVAAWADTLAAQAYVVADAVLPTDLLVALQARAAQQSYRPAQIGRSQPQIVSATRSDEIAWVNSSNLEDAAWMQWLDQLQQSLNRQMFLGLRSVESHFAHYPPGARYKRHLDAFAERGNTSTGVAPEGTNRVVSLVLYLHQYWPADGAGELVLYSETDSGGAIRVVPVPNRLVLFMSTRVPHEVLPATQDRYSLAAWFRA